MGSFGRGTVKTQIMQDFRNFPLLNIMNIPADLRLCLNKERAEKSI